jgi:hypothetical protein
MINEIKLRELFDAEFEKQKEFIAGLFLMGERERLTIFKWFCLGFQTAYPPLFTFKTPDLTPEKQAAILKELRDMRIGSHFIVEPDSKSIFVYSWQPYGQQRTMIILADSREESDTIFKTQFEECAESPEHFVPTHYVTQLFVDGGESTIIYNN